MSFLHLVGILPLLLLGIRIVKEIHQVLIHLQLIFFDDGQVIAIIRMHPGAPLLLGVHRIGTDDASFHKRRSINAAAALISFSLLRTARCRQDDPTLTLIEG